MTPTGEQQAAIDLFGTGASLAIEAGAGTGKTSTLAMLAATTSRPGQYIAFNKAIVDDSKAKFPGSVQANTAHSLAWRAIGFRYGDRLRSGARMSGRDIAARLGLQPMVVPDFQDQPKVLSAGYLASLATQAVVGFCQSADPEITERHFPYVDGVDRPGADGQRTWSVNNAIRRVLLPSARAMWADLQSVNGWVPYRHDHYLKAWQLAGPRINADFILFDEAQDANPVIAAIVAAQTQAQLVYVGDTQQQIYEWTGAVNALAKVDVEQRTFLTQSFRFGQAIADVANGRLALLDAALRLKGLPSIDSIVGPLAEPSAILARTNAVAVEAVLNAQQDGTSVHLVGGGADVVEFCRAASELKQGRRTSHHDLACFADWFEVQEYVRNDPSGADLRLMVKLVDKFGPEVIIGALAFMPDEKHAELTVSTAHKAKGREWNAVRLASDFAPRPGTDGEATAVEPSELRLQYVAVTRARFALDASALAIAP